MKERNEAIFITGLQLLWSVADYLYPNRSLLPVGPHKLPAFFPEYLATFNRLIQFTSTNKLNSLQSINWIQLMIWIFTSEGASSNHPPPHKFRGDHLKLRPLDRWNGNPIGPMDENQLHSVIIGLQLRNSFQSMMMEGGMEWKKKIRKITERNNKTRKERRKMFKKLKA